MLNALHKLAAALIACLAATCAARAETALERIERTGVARVGYANEVPFAYLTPDGSLTGESAVVAAFALSKLGARRIEPVLTAGDALIPDLLAGRFDVIVGGMTITPEKSNDVLFSNPHYQLNDTLLVVRSNPRRLNSYAGIAADRRLKLAVVTDSPQYDYALDAGVSERQIISLPNGMAQLHAVRTGRAAAAAGSALAMQTLAQRDPARVQALNVFAGDPGHAGYGAFAFRPQDADLCEAVNGVLKGWLGSKEHLTLVAPFGFGRMHLTSKTMADVVANAAP